MRLHSRTQEEHLSRVQNFFDLHNHQELEEALRDAFNDYFDDERFQAWCCGFSLAAESSGARALMEEFLKQYPLSLYPVKVDFSEYLLQQGEIDGGANEARSYLSLLQETGMQELMENNDAVQDSVGRAFLLLSSVYTEMAARSYSKRLFSEALTFPLEEYWRGRFEAEIKELDRELETKALLAADQKWELFFTQGAGEKDLMYACEVRGFPILRKRLELLAQRLRDRPGVELGTEEIYQLVYQTEEGSFTLV